MTKPAGFATSIEEPKPGWADSFLEKAPTWVVFLLMSLLVLTVAGGVAYISSGDVSKGTRTAVIGIGAALTTATMAFLTSWVTTWRTERYARNRETRQSRADIQREERQKDAELNRENRQLNREVEVQQELRFLALLTPLRTYEAFMSRFEKALGGPCRDPERANVVLQAEYWATLNELRPGLDAVIETAKARATGDVDEVLGQMLRVLRNHPGADYEIEPLPPLPSVEFQRVAFPKSHAQAPSGPEAASVEPADS